MLVGATRAVTFCSVFGTYLLALRGDWLAERYGQNDLFWVDLALHVVPLVLVWYLYRHTKHWPYGFLVFLGLVVCWRALHDPRDVYGVDDQTALWGCLPVLILVLYVLQKS